MIYKKFELSQSLNGKEIVHIARNSSGNVVFREGSEARLRAAIDKSIEDQIALEELLAKKKEEKDNAKLQKRGLFAPAQINEDEVDDEEEINEPQEILVPQPQRITRGPDGKFISKSQLEKEEPVKKGFWDRLK